VIGLAIGLALQLALAAFQVLGYLASSQMGLAMAVMNDPLNGSASDAVSNLLFILCMLVFFAVDGHLVVTGVLGASFKAWPVGRLGRCRCRPWPCRWAGSSRRPCCWPCRWCSPRWWCRSASAS
jgi:flagellar biosynthesis protein FliR